ncbi:MAG: MMPL family transporter [Burkholderiaceae bacterium]
MSSRALIFLVWTVALLIAIVVVARAPLLTDMSVFLPTAPSAEQKLLIANLQQGESARTLLISVGPVDPERQAEVSAQLVNQWRELSAVDSASNGNLDDFAVERNKLLELRYLLSDNDNGRAFEPPALTASLTQARGLLASSAGLFNKQTILRDPTGSALQSLQRLAGAGGPKRHDGVWVDAPGEHLLFILTIGIDGADLDAQERVLRQIKTPFESRTDLGAATITLTGAPVFAVESRNQIRGDVITLSSIGLALIVSLLLLIFRSLAVLAVALVPLFAAVLCGSAAVVMGFGSAHALTLGFGVALIGECVDYALYHLVHRHTDKPRDAAFWAPIRLGVLTSLTGFAALFFSDFPGLSQLAVFAIIGLSAGFLTTRWLMPLLPLPAPTRIAVRRMSGLEQALRRLAGQLATVRTWALCLVAICLVIATSHRGSLWSTDIAALNPVSAQARQLDTAMREALGGPDINTMVLVRADRPGQDVLNATDAVSRELRALAALGQFKSIKTVTDLLPSVEVQARRQQSLPSAQQLRSRISEIQPQTGLPVRALSTFIKEVSAARTRTPVSADDYQGTRLAATINSLMTRIDGRNAAIITLETNPDRPVSSIRLQNDLNQALEGNAALTDASVDVLNLKNRTDELYAGYIHDALKLSLTGAVAILALLIVALRRWQSVIRVILPIVGALAIIVAGFALSGTAMHLLHLVGLLLVAAIGSNYALVLAESARAENEQSLILAPLVLATLTTVAGFGVLAASSIPLLSALGITVGVGAPLVLILAATASRTHEQAII